MRSEKYFSIISVCFHYSQIYYIWWLLLSLKIIFIFRVYVEEVLTLLFEFSYVCALCRFVCQLLSFKHSEQLTFIRSFVTVALYMQMSSKSGQRYIFYEFTMQRDSKECERENVRKHFEKKYFCSKLCIRPAQAQSQRSVKKQLKNETKTKKGDSDVVVEMDTQRQTWSHAIMII